MKPQVSEALLENARKVIARTKADNLMGKVISADQMLTFALADALLAQVGRGLPAASQEK